MAKHMNHEAFSSRVESGDADFMTRNTYTSRLMRTAYLYPEFVDRLFVCAMLQDDLEVQLRGSRHYDAQRLAFRGVPLWQDQLAEPGPPVFPYLIVRTLLDDPRMVGRVREEGNDSDFPIGEVVVRENRETVVTHRDVVGVGHGEQRSQLYRG
jgi:hypothetical protein